MSLKIDVPTAAGKSFGLCGVLMALTALTRGRSVAASEALLLQVAAAIVSFVIWQRHSVQSFADLEEGLHEVLTQTGSAVLSQAVARHLEHEPERLCIDGVPHRKVLDTSGLSIDTPYGLLEVERALYRPVGQRNAPTVGALDRRLGLIQKATPRLARIQAHLLSQMPSRAAKEALVEVGIQSRSRSRVDRWGRVVGQRFADQTPQALNAVRSEVEAPKVARMLAGLDRVSLPMHEEVVGKPFSEGTVSKRKRVAYVRQPPEGFEVRYRMAYVGSLTFYNADGRTLGTFRYAARADSDVAELAAQVAADIAWVRQVNPEAALDVCQDGAKELWTVMKAALADLVGPPPRMLVDWYHFWQRTHPVLTLLFDDDEIGRCKRRLQRKPGSLARLRQDLLDAVAVATKRVDVLYDEVDKYLTYLDDREGLFDFPTQLAQHRAMGSGPTEATCKLVVNLRMKRGGQRWKKDGAGAILALSAALHSRAALDTPRPEFERGRQLWEQFAQHHCSNITEYRDAA